MTCEVFIYGVVHAFPHQVMQRRTIVYVPDVHTGTFANRFEPF
jgi:hypothetical protein